MTRTSVVDTQRELLHQIQTEGVQVAYETAVAVCRDPKAPAPAKATASATLFRVAGYFEKRASDADRKEPHEMTADELAEAIRMMERRSQAAPDDGDIFA